MEKKNKNNICNIKLFITFIIVLIFSIISTIHASADIIVYEDKIDDNTSIKEDFNLLGLDYTSYHKSNKYLTNPEAYIVAYAETYKIENDTNVVYELNDLDSIPNMQSYIYLYTPYNYEQIKSISFNYSINNESYKYTYNADGLINPFLYSTSNGLLKLKGFDYRCTKNDKITIQLSTIKYSIKNILVTTGNSYMDVIHVFNDSSNPLSIETDVTTVLCTHNENTLQIDLQFNSVLIIDDYTAVCVPVYQDDNINNYINNLFNSGETALNLFFYNFNFPNSISVDSVEYAKFSYIYNTYQDQLISGINNSKWTYQNKLINSENVVNEYSNTTKKVRVNQNSIEVEFPIFSLENRIEAGQLDSYDRIYEIYKDSFNYDCSVLIDSTIKTSTVSYHGVYNQIDYEYTVLDDIDLLELHYMSNGTLYKSKVIADPIKEEDVEGTDTAKGDLEKKKEAVNFLDDFLKLFEDMSNNNFMNWLISNFPNSLYLIIFIIILIPILIALLPHILIFIIKLILKFIKFPFKIARKVMKKE